jgi:hypothetical protein
LGAGGNSILTEVAESIANAKLAFERARAELADAKEELNRAHGRLEAAIKHYEETCKAAQGEHPSGRRRIPWQVLHARNLPPTAAR